MSAHKQSRTGLAELIEAHKVHLRELQMQSARLGIQTPVHTLTEIERYKTEISHLITAETVAPTEDVCTTLGTIGMYQLLYAHIMRLDGDIWMLAQQVDKLSVKLDTLLMTLAQSYLRDKINDAKGT
jgi:hypothetical protein